MALIVLFMALIVIYETDNRRNLVRTTNHLLKQCKLWQEDPLALDCLPETVVRRRGCSSQNINLILQHFSPSLVALRSEYTIIIKLDQRSRSQ